MSQTEANQTPPEGNTPPAKQENGDNGENTQKTFSQEAVNEMISNRVNKLNEKFDEKLAKSLADAKADWERKAKLSDEEKEDEAQKEKLKAIEAREHKITMRERRADALTTLSEKNIPAELADYVVDLDQDKTESNIDKLEKVWSAAIEAGVKARINGKTPTENNSAPTQGSSSSVGRDNGRGVTSF